MFLNTELPSIIIFILLAYAVINYLASMYFGSKGNREREFQFKATSHTTYRSSTSTDRIYSSRTVYTPACSKLGSEVSELRLRRCLITMAIAVCLTLVATFIGGRHIITDWKQVSAVLYKIFVTGFYI